MTTEVFVPAPIQTVTGTGPYPVGHPYQEGGLIVRILQSENIVTLGAGDFSALPVSSDVSGDVTLSAAAATLYAGEDLQILRSTNAEQGWQGQGGAREKSLERQLDILTQAHQDLVQLVARSFRVSSGSIADLPGGRAGKVLLFDESENPAVGPSIAEIEEAAANAQAATDAAAAAALSAAAANTFDPANYQPISQILSAIAALALGENRGFYATSENEFAAYDLTAAGRAIAGAANAAAQIAALGLNNGRLCGVGEVTMHLRGTVPAGKLELNGGSILHDDFPVFGAYLGSSPGDTIVLTDARAEGIRGWDHGRGIDPGRVIGSVQPGQLATHKHATVHFTNLNQFGTAGVVNTTGVAQTDGPNIQPAHLTAEPISTDGSAYIGGPENLMRNVAFMFCVQTEA